MYCGGTELITKIWTMNCTRYEPPKQISNQAFLSSLEKFSSTKNVQAKFTLNWHLLGQMIINFDNCTDQLQEFWAWLPFLILLTKISSETSKVREWECGLRQTKLLLKTSYELHEPKTNHSIRKHFRSTNFLSKSFWKDSSFLDVTPF